MAIAIIDYIIFIIMYFYIKFMLMMKILLSSFKLKNLNFFFLIYENNC